MKSVTIAGLEVQRIEYRGQSVVTYTIIDRVHQRVDGTAKRTVGENRGRFVLGEDFFELTSDEIRTMSAEGVLPPRTASATVMSSWLNSRRSSPRALLTAGKNLSARLVFQNSVYLRLIPPLCASPLNRRS
ncbi:hypothetical protein ACO34A_09835 [Rhizobium sp. ACO-34A]|nr:hypothetical protein ACO34A_09835 [Rhizobium sp. ACO-34A]